MAILFLLFFAGLIILAPIIFVIYLIIKKTENKPDSNKPTSILDSAFVKWIAEDWIMKLGAFLLLLGFGWLITYAFTNNLISPDGRIITGLILGVLIMLLGIKRLDNYPAQGDIFLTLGETIVLITVVFGRVWYEFYSPISAIFTVAITSIFIAYLSVKKSRRFLSYLSVVFASIAPILSYAPEASATSYFIYLLIVTIGTLWITYLTNKRGLILASSIIFTLISINYQNPQLQEFNNIILLVAMFTAVYVSASINNLLKKDFGNQVLDLAVTTWSGIYLTTWIMAMPVIEGKTDYRFYILFVTALIFFGAGYMLFKKLQSKAGFYSLSAVGFIMSYCALSLILSEDLSTVAFVLEILTLSITNYLVTSDIKVSRIINLLLAFPIISTFYQLFFFYDIYLGSDSYYTTYSFLNSLVLASVLLALGFFYHDQANESNDEFSIIINKGGIIIGSIYFFRIIWLFIGEIFAGINPQYNFSVAVSLFIFSCIGIGTYYFGIKNKGKVSRIYGIVVLLLVVARIIFIDIFNMDILGRVVTLLTIGSLLISTSFITKKFTNNSKSI